MAGNADVTATLRLRAKDESAKAFRSLAGRFDAVDKKARQVERATRATMRAEQAAGRVAAVNRAAGRTEAALLARAGGILAPAAIAYGAGRSVQRFASVERAIDRIGITAGATAAETKTAFGVIDKAAYDYAMTQDAVTAGLDSLVASGRDLPSALAFLPAVTATAQAAGAEITDMATTADALGNSFDITGDKMQSAFDILVMAGKEGKFELKDMASYLPTLAPAFEVLGYKGEAGIKKLAAALQIVRQRTGSAGEAATAFQNVLQKMETEETAKKFGKFGIDLRAEMAQARKEGADLLDVFVKLATEAVDGDLSKLPQLFGDQQMLVGVRALIQGGDDLTAMVNRLGGAAGSTKKDLDRLLAGTEAKIDRMSSSWDRLYRNMGAALSEYANPAMDILNADMETGQAYAAGLEKYQEQGGTRFEAQEEFNRRYGEANPDFSWYNPVELNERVNAFVDAMAAFGRGDAQTPFDGIDAQISRQANAGMSLADQYQTYGEGRTGPRKLTIDGTAVTRGTPLPHWRPGGGPSDLDRLGAAYQSYGEGRRAGEAGGRAIADPTDARALLDRLTDRAVRMQDTLRADRAKDTGPVPVTIENMDYGPQLPSEPDWNGWGNPDAPISIPDYSADGSSGWRGGDFNERRFGDDEIAVQGIDELRQAMSDGSINAETSLRAGGDSVGQSILTAAQALERAAAAIGTNGREAAAAISGAHVSFPPPASNGGTGASGRKGVSSTDAGVAQ
jgi:TP901 family phage tail tape measure protein